MFDFSGKSVLVTGGTSGIGRAVAESFLRAGAETVAVGLPVGDDAPKGMRVETLDVTDIHAVESVMSTIDKLDVVVNAAGVIKRDMEFEIDVFSHVLDVNLTGAMRVCMAAYPKLTASRGCIVNVASMLSFFGGPRVPAYSASKGGVTQLTRSLAVAWAKDGIRVNAVAPGWITTPLTEALQKDPVRSGELMARTPLGRWGKADEIAGPVLFLASDAASFMTGAVVPVDGGYSIA